MAMRLEHARHKYGEMSGANKGIDGENGYYTAEFLRDFDDTLSRFINRWKSGGTTATVNELVTLLIRLKTYACGGYTKGGLVESGNTEYLMDVANFAFIEFIYPQLEGAKCIPTTDQGSPGIAGFTPKLLELEMKGEQ